MKTGKLVMLMLIARALTGCQDQGTEPADFALDPGPLLFNEASGLQYHTFLTGGADANEALPWIIGLHGVGGGADRYAQTFTGIDFKSRVYVLRGRNDFSRGGYDWAGASPSEQGPYGPGILTSAELVSRFARDLKSRDSNEGLPLVTGFSQGAILTLAIATHFPEDFRAAVPVSGWLPDSIMPTAPPASRIPVRASHGAHDDVLPYDDTVRKISRLQELGMDITLYTFEDNDHQLSTEVKARWGQVMESLLYPEANPDPTRAE